LTQALECAVFNGKERAGSLIPGGVD